MSDANYQKLDVWRRSMSLATTVYQLTNRFPASEKSGLAASMRRSVTAMLVKIADGHEKHTAKERHTAVSDALNAVRELRTYLMIARQLGYVSWLKTRRLNRRIQPVDALLDDLDQFLASTTARPVVENPLRNAA